MLSYYNCLPLTSVPYSHFFPPLHSCFSSLLFYLGHFCWADFLCILIGFCREVCFLDMQLKSLCLQAERQWPGQCHTRHGMWPASSPGCCFRAAGDDWHQCPILLSFHGQGIQRSCLAIRDTVLVLRRGIFHFLAKLCAEGLHPAQIRLLCVSFLELELLYNVP